MALKAKIHEKCQRCGALAATLEGEYVSYAHNCPEAPPGPSDPPRTWHVSSINFVRGEWSVEELRKQLDEARTELAATRTKAKDLRRRVQLARQALDDEARVAG